MDRAAARRIVDGAAYLFTKLTQPLRIAATLAITPAVATLLRRFRKQPELARRYHVAVVPTAFAVAGDGTVLQRLA